MKQAIQTAGISKDEINKIFGTGSGKNSVTMATDTVNEIKAMAKAAHCFFPNARTVVDVGAEEGRAASAALFGFTLCQKGKAKKK